MCFKARIFRHLNAVEKKKKKKMKEEKRIKANREPHNNLENDDHDIIKPYPFPKNDKKKTSPIGSGTTTKKTILM